MTDIRHVRECKTKNLIASYRSCLELVKKHYPYLQASSCRACYSRSLTVHSCSTKGKPCAWALRLLSCERSDNAHLWLNLAFAHVISFTRPSERLFSNSTIRREDPRPLTRRRGQRAYSNLENFHEVFWGIKLQRKG